MNNSETITLQPLRSGTNAAVADPIVEPKRLEPAAPSVSEAAANADFSEIRYAQCWEDADVLLEALDIRPGDICFSIASGGDNTLAMLAKDPERVVAVDLNPSQLACLELRVAGFRRLDHGALLELIGSRSGDRRQELYRECRPLLSTSAAHFWDQQQLDIDSVKQSFRHKVIGQDAAVDCLVERIAMLKAGLTDPDRPVGVFLFAGPTGTGKTEIAKTLAELLFGSPEQMIRLDMSEYQDPDSVWRLLGRNNDKVSTGSLVSRIREEPFSVVLLDEFEKAHQKVWDVFLQVFDDGRLSDTQGEAADFRHAIIILTSNLGATINSEAGVGFTSTKGSFSPDDVMRTENKTFRREFANRLKGPQQTQRDNDRPRPGRHLVNVQRHPLGNEH